MSMDLIIFNQDRSKIHLRAAMLLLWKGQVVFDIVHTHTYTPTIDKDSR